MKRLIHKTTKNEGNMSTNNSAAKRKNMFVAFSNLAPDKRKTEEINPDAEFTLNNSNDPEFDGLDESEASPKPGNKSGKNQKADDDRDSKIPSDGGGKQPPRLEPDWVRQSNGKKSLLGLKMNGQSAAGDASSSLTPKNQSPRLIESLIAKGIVTREIIEKALELQRNSPDKRRIIDILISNFGVDHDTILKFVASFYAFQSIDPTPAFGNKEKLQFMRQILQSLPPYYYEMAVARKILPYEMYTNGQDKLVIITPDTTHPDVHEVARAFQFPKYEIKSVALGNWNELWRQLAFDQGAKQLGLDVDDEFAQMNKEEYDAEVEKSL